MNQFEKDITMDIVKVLVVKWTIIFVVTKLVRRAVKSAV